MRFATLINGCTCDPGCYPEGCKTYCPVHGDEIAKGILPNGWSKGDPDMRTRITIMADLPDDVDISDVLDAACQTIETLQENIDGEARIEATQISEDDVSVECEQHVLHHNVKEYIGRVEQAGRSRREAIGKENTDDASFLAGAMVALQHVKRDGVLDWLSPPPPRWLVSIVRGTNPFDPLDDDQ